MDDELASFRFRLCADDYAVSPGVSDGILEAIDAGRLSCTSAMTNRPGWKDAARFVASHGGRAEFGIHLNLTLGRPLTPMPSFVRNGEFPPLGQVVSMALTRRLPEAEIRAEIAAQIDAFTDAAGMAPDFLDGHQHVQGLPGISSLLLDELARRGLNRQGFWLRDSRDRMSRILRRRAEAPKAMVVAALTFGFGHAARKMGFETNDGFAGFSAFDTKRDFGADFERFLIAPGARHLVMCHPGRRDSALEEVETVVATREKELAYLLSDRFEDALMAADAALVDPPVRIAAAG
jgi:predicted glycoside hydrolase/deacetylase ChbG (UPF0249 family)